MVNVLWTWILLLLLQLIQTISCHDNKRVRRAVFDIIPKYEKHAATNIQERRLIRKTVRRTLNQTEYYVNMKRNIEGKLEDRKMFFNRIKFKETEFHRLNEENKQVFKGSGYRVKNDSFEILCVITLHFLLNPNIFLIENLKMSKSKVI